ncbi:MAG: dockerin type I domain-containing protein [Phycisphaerales bacterium]|jgi:hypothetical protein|nr:dockerin type I domain-containing protein [Phycisphaerales bacterium]
MNFSLTQRPALLLITCVVSAALSTSADALSTPSCVFSDDFNDNNLSPLWDASYSTGSTVSATETGGRVKFGASQNFYPNASTTIVASDYWGMDMMSSWAITGDWWADPPQPDWGESSLSLGILLLGDPYEASITYGATATIGWYKDPEFEYRHETAIYWSNGYWADWDDDYSSRTSGTSYVWYDWYNDTLYLGDSIGDPNAWSIPNFRYNCPGSPEIATILIAVNSTDDVPSFSTGTYAVDNLCIVYGNTVESGACCINLSCQPGYTEAECDSWSGVFAGGGTNCYDTVCEEDQHSYCTGDVNGDATVSQADILAVIDAWGTNNSYMDIDQDGTVGILDLLMLLEYWGDCP